MSGSPSPTRTRCSPAAADLPRRWPDAAARPPLWGIPIAVKDNVDVRGLPTTAGCPDYAYQPAESAELVRRLIDAGALIVGKTNMDQFASGLTGARSAYGICRSPFDPDYIGGGSSSGSALAVSLGLAAAAIGTDTAGSGRVPAAFTNTVGLKPSRGLVSTRGLVPACQSLDCPSIFALSVADASAVLAVIAGAIRAIHGRARCRCRRPCPAMPGAGLRIGVADLADEPIDDAHPLVLPRGGGRAGRVGGRAGAGRIDAFREAGDLLYDGPWVAERLSELEPWIEAHPPSLLPVTATVLGNARDKTAVDAFRGFHRLTELTARARAVWAAVDALVLPTVPETPTVADTLRRSASDEHPDGPLHHVRQPARPRGRSRSRRRSIRRAGCPPASRSTRRPARTAASGRGGPAPSEPRAARRRDALPGSTVPRSVRRPAGAADVAGRRGRRAPHRPAPHRPADRARGPDGRPDADRAGLPAVRAADVAGRPGSASRAWSGSTEAASRSRSSCIDCRSMHSASCSSRFRRRSASAVIEPRRRSSGDRLPVRVGGDRGRARHHWLQELDQLSRRGRPPSMMGRWTWSSELKAAGLRRGDAVALVVAGEQVAIAAAGRTWTGERADIAAVEEQLRPRWIWWSNATPAALLADGLRLATCWDLVAVHRLLFGGWAADPGLIWAALHDRPDSSIPALGQLTLGRTLPATTAATPKRPSGPTVICGRSGRAAAGPAHPARLAAWASLAVTAAGLQARRLDALKVGGDPTATARSESAAELLCTELAADGLPVDREQAETILASFIGPRPSDENEALRLRARRDDEVLRHAPAGVEADLRNPASVRALLARCGIEVSDTRSWRLEPFVGAHPVVEALLTWRKAERIATTYGYRWLDERVADGRLRGAWSGSDGAAGRMTAQAGLHNLPADLRGAVVAEPGHVFVRADLGQIEPRILAAISGDRSFARAADSARPLCAGCRAATGRAAGGQGGGARGDVRADLGCGRRRRCVASRTPTRWRCATCATRYDAGRAGRDVRTHGGRLVRMWPIRSGWTSRRCARRSLAADAMPATRSCRVRRRSSSRRGPSPFARAARRWTRASCCACTTSYWCRCQPPPAMTQPRFSRTVWTRPRRTGPRRLRCGLSRTCRSSSAGRTRRAERCRLEECRGIEMAMAGLATPVRATDLDGRCPTARPGCRVRSRVSCGRRTRRSPRRSGCSLPAGRFTPTRCSRTPGSRPVRSTLTSGKASRSWPSGSRTGCAATPSALTTCCDGPRTRWHLNRRRTPMASISPG